MSDKYPPEKLEAIANDMGVALYHRYTEADAVKFLKMTVSEIRELRDTGKIAYLRLSPSSQVEFFGIQLLEFLLESTVPRADSFGSLQSKNEGENPERIIRCPDVTKMTGLSRTSLWRLEKEGVFPRRIALGKASVGWRLSEVQSWMNSREML